MIFLKTTVVSIAFLSTTIAHAQNDANAAKENSAKYRYARHQDSLSESKGRNVLAVGYQLGGLSLIGVEYEIRFHNYFGINFGAGFRGYTGGMKVHTGPKKNNPFFLVSYKDGGFGLIQTAGVEYGGRWIIFKKKDAGFIFQGGLAKVMNIDPDFAKYLYKGNKAPDILLSIGIGFSW
jgi:hypothetical protein